MPRFRLTLAAMLLVASLLWLGFAPPAVYAEDIDWEGNGTNAAGACSNIGEFDDLDPEVGQQGWSFNLTSPDNVGEWDLTATFAPDGEIGPIDGVQSGEGNGAVHFVVYTSIGATLTSATATGGSLQSNLVVSHCEVGSGEPALLIHKVCEGGAGQFGFTLDPDGDPAGPHLVNCGGTSDPIALEAGTEYTLTENDPPAETWTLDGFECNVDYQDTENGVIFTAPADTLVECTFTNTFDPGENPADPTLVIHKACEGTAAGEFAFSLDPDGDPSGPYTVSCDSASDSITLVPGQEYTLVETDLPSDVWTLLEIDCNLSFEESEDGDGVVFTASSGAAIECTATNEATTFILQSFPGTTGGPSTPRIPSGGGGGSGGGDAGGEASPVATESPVADVAGVQRLPATGSGGAGSTEAGSSTGLLASAVVAFIIGGGAGLAFRRGKA